MQDDEGDLHISTNLPVLDTLISSDGHRDKSESFGSQLVGHFSRPNTHNNNNNRDENRKNKMNGQRLPKDSNLLGSYWPSSNIGNIFDIGWDPNPPKGSK
ncbi:Netrin receptor UNC5B [Schistosoma japonicum]|uniref:Netrin receptor UNC5B n=1 Tax=Schistosoma japonicum TaxID=6182 RepID=A0A4Z2D1C0_SCHJA|nr:Netrin receptor UNC5B [Schistosoma japonicum]